jgi:hypothetical protein
MHHITRRLSPSFIVAIAALFVALAGTAVTSPIALAACPIQGCDPADPKPPSLPTTPAPPKLRVTLQTIHPVETQDDNVDQLYVLVKGSFVGMLNVSNLSYWNLNVTRDVYAPADVSLYDDDWPSSDDWLGTAWLDPPALGASYTKTIRLYGSGAVYDLTVKVTRIA